MPLRRIDTERAEGFRPSRSQAKYDRNYDRVTNRGRNFDNIWKEGRWADNKPVRGNSNHLGGGWYRTGYTHGYQPMKRYGNNDSYRVNSAASLF